MTLPKPYGGRNVEDLEQECSDGYFEYASKMPVEDLSGFNPKVRTYGQPISWVISREFVPGWIVLAGLSGNMSGVPVAVFPSKEAASRYSVDLEQGKVMALMNADRWIAFVKAAHTVKKLDASLRSQLIAMGRKTGLLASGEELGVDEIHQMYANAT